MNYMDILKKKNLKATPQRLAVLTILGRHLHPTIEELYSQIKELHPSVSLATIYKNLNTLEGEGLIVEINTPDNKTKYDIFTTPHIHVCCKNCGEVKDVYFDDALSFCKKVIEDKVDHDIFKTDILITTKSCDCCVKN